MLKRVQWPITAVHGKRGKREGRGPMQCQSRAALTEDGLLCTADLCAIQACSGLAALLSALQLRYTILRGTFRFSHVGRHGNWKLVQPSIHRRRRPGATRGEARRTADHLPIPLQGCCLSSCSFFISSFHGVLNFHVAHRPFILTVGAVVPPGCQPVPGGPVPRGPLASLPAPGQGTDLLVRNCCMPLCSLPN